MLKNTKISIVVLNWNRKKITIECINSVYKSIEHKKNVELIVVDNASKDGSAKAFYKLGLPIKIIENKVNLLWPGGNNVGIKYALSHGAKAVLLLNNDVTLIGNAVSELENALFSKESVGIVAPKTYIYGKKNIIADVGGFIKKNRYFGVNTGVGEYDFGQYDYKREIDFVGGSAMMIKKEVFEKVGMLPEIYGHYYEDVDFCMRAKNAGFQLIYGPNALISHRVGATLVVNSPLHTYYNTRNHLLFVERNAPLVVKLKEFMRIPKTIFEFLFLANDPARVYALIGIRDYIFRRFGRRSYW